MQALQYQRCAFGVAIEHLLVEDLVGDLGACAARSGELLPRQDRTLVRNTQERRSQSAPAE